MWRTLLSQRFFKTLRYEIVCLCSYHKNRRPNREVGSIKFDSSGCYYALPHHCPLHFWGQLSKSANTSMEMAKRHLALCAGDKHPPSVGRQCTNGIMLYSFSAMIHRLVHQPVPCYDFCPVQVIAIKEVHPTRRARKPTS